MGPDDEDGLPAGRGPFDLNVNKTETEMLERFPAVFSSLAQIPKHQLGWRMAILPFRVSGTPRGYSIAFGMAEEVSAAISRFRQPRLIASVTFWDGTGPAADVLGRCRLYELDYMLDGTIEITGLNVRMKVVLLDVLLDFEVIWTGSFDGTLDDLFTLQSQIAAEVVRQLDPDLSLRGPASEPPVATTVPGAHHLVLSAIQEIHRLDRASFLQVRTSLTEAIALDPHYAAAYAWLAHWSFMAVGLGWVSDARHVTEMAGVAAERAIELDPTDARALAVAGHVKAYLLHDVAQALELHARAVEMNPNLAIAWAMSSASKFYSGQHMSAVHHAKTARQLSPRDPHMLYIEHNLTVAYFFHRDLESALAVSEVVLARNPDHVSAINVHLGILGYLGRRPEAARWLAKLISANPSVSIGSTVARAPWRPAERDYFAEGLRLAGVPD